MKCLGQFSSPIGEPFEQVDRRGLVIETDDDQGHRGHAYLRLVAPSRRFASRAVAIAWVRCW